jgi:hypothetical protein
MGGDAPVISDTVQTAQDRLAEAGLAFPGDFQGCTEQEVLSIEEHFRIQLPRCYRDFLTVMGRYAGDFLVGSDYSFPKLVQIGEGAVALLRRCLPRFTLPRTAFVFFSHQGYTYEWFKCQYRDDDPPVVMFTELEREPRMISNSFSAWLLSAVDADIAASRALQKRQRGVEEQLPG